MTIVREEENGNNGRHAGGVWRGSRCSSSLDTRAGALARVVGSTDAPKSRARCFGVVGPEQPRINRLRSCRADARHATSVRVRPANRTGRGDCCPALGTAGNLWRKGVRSSPTSGRKDAGAGRVAGVGSGDGLSSGATAGLPTDDAAGFQCHQGERCSGVGDMVLSIGAD